MKIKNQDTVQSNILGNEKFIEYFISTKPFFLRSPSYSGDYFEQSQLNLKSLGVQFEIVHENIILLDQIHSSKVVIIDDTKLLYQADAAITNRSGIMLIVLASDCVPLILYDRVKNIIGVIHAGWRGLERGVIINTLNTMKTEFGCSFKNLTCYIGPCISQDNYEVGEDVSCKFQENYSDYIVSQSNSIEKYLLDVRGIAKKQLIEYGILEINIEVAQYCTYRDKELFHSYRRSTQTGESYVGNNALGVMLK